MDMLHRAVLRTARLELRPLRADDSNFVIASVGRLMVSRYLSVVPHPYGRADFDRFAQIASPGLHWMIEAAEGPAGLISLAPRLGFWIAPERQGQGYATEAARAVLEAHFADGHEKSVESGYFADNRASAAVHRALGFRTTSVVNEMCSALGQPRALLRQRLDRDTWLRQCLAAPTSRFAAHPAAYNQGPA
ncbi:GNAT family N-acetyltransferase [Xinfangfangia sp. CPCC 101601]|uniref:GNAT family N-acetyltransferase n=1 Tax=Pseudogemmobacter lacusdianii TaxID=3069608 RepID=A0ABU0W2Z5_9RHOB|nr:GNAT family N-acetyltransferase [Xinfangfangia sp. CPCC 101601]MDQ2068158.1 GNAT family N-acetyltransferase [Xinfangfangia sp. CPCC 101601]